MNIDKETNTRVVLVGCGGISNAWLKSCSQFDDIEIVGLVDLEKEKAEALREKYELAQAVAGTDLKEMLKALKPDAVFDCTIPEAHCQVTLEALAHGCHVLGEKPLTTNMTDARRMVEAASAAGRIYAVLQNRRYLDQIVAYRQTITGSGIGALTTLNADFYLGPHFGGFREQMKHVLLHDMAIHSFDQARFIAGADPISVYCHEWNPEGSWFAHGASAIAVFEMTQNIVFTYRGSWCSQGLPTSWQCQWRAIGTEGTATWDGNKSIECEAVKSSEDFFFEVEKVKPAEPAPLQYSGHAGVIREFTDCLQNGRTPQTICTDNIKSLAMVEAAIESAETGKKVLF